MANYRAGDMEKWATKINKALDQVVRSTVLDISAKVIDRTPVDTGRLKGNWQASLSRPSSGANGAPDKSGAVTKAIAQPVIHQAPGNVYYMVNNLPYAQVAEYGMWGQGAYSTAKTSGGYSIQAPRGMVRVTMTEFNRSVRKAVASV